MYHLIISVGAAVLCIVILSVLKYVAISKMRIDERDQKKKPKLTAEEVLDLLRNLKPFPVSVHKGWKLHSYRHNSRVWYQEISVNRSCSELFVFAAYTKTEVPAQLILQILRDVSKTPNWKPGSLATSIISRPAEPETGSRMKGVMGNFPVQHDIVMEESSPNFRKKKGLSSKLFGNSAPLQTIKKEFRRYWHREDNGVCWHLQICERDQEWLFFLTQPVEDVEECMISVLGYRDQEDDLTTASYVSEVISSLTEYILYRKLLATPLIDLKLPTSSSERIHRQGTSWDENAGPGKRMFMRFRSLVENPMGSEKCYSAKQQLIRSNTILKHNSQTLPRNIEPSVSNTLKTNSLDRRKNMPNLRSMKNADGDNSSLDSRKDRNDSNESSEASDVNSSELEKQNKKLNGINHQNKNKTDQELSADNSNVRTDLSENVVNANEKDKDIDRMLDADVNAQEEFEQSDDSLFKSTDSKEGIQHMVTANQTAAELLAVALQASNIDLSKSLQDQVMNSGGWMFCGLDNDVVVLKKISMKENLHCYLGKGVIQADPRVVWNAVRNPRTKFTYDDSLKKVDVLEKVSESIKIVYYYHEVLQLFKTECCDMIVTQNERVDRGDKYILAFQSTDRAEVPLPKNTMRVKVLPSGWIIEPVTKERKLYSMVTIIMQIDFGNLPFGTDRTPFEDLISKQPMSIAYLRQYLKGCSFPK